MNEFVSHIARSAVFEKEKNTHTDQGSRKSKKVSAYFVS